MIENHKNKCPVCFSKTKIFEKKFEFAYDCSISNSHFWLKIDKINKTIKRIGYYINNHECIGYDHKVGISLYKSENGFSFDEVRIGNYSIEYFYSFESIKKLYELIEFYS